MPTNPQMLLRGLAKFLGVVIAAGLTGALIGVGLAKLSGDDAASDASLPATTAVAATAPERNQTTGRTTAEAVPKQSTTSKPAGSKSTTSGAGGVYRVPRIQVLSARLRPVSDATGRAVVALRIRVTNRGKRSLKINTPVLVSGADETRLGASARARAGALFDPIQPGSSATGVLRFSVSRAVAQRLQDDPAARLRIANRTRAVTITPRQPAG